MSCMPLNPFNKCFRAAACTHAACTLHARIVHTARRHPLCTLHTRIVHTAHTHCEHLHCAHGRILHISHTQKKHHFWPENCQKMPTFTLNQSFLGPGGQLVPPLPYFEGA